MRVSIFDRGNERAVELDPEAKTFWNLEGVNPPPWLSMPSTRMTKTGDTKVLLGVRCSLYVSGGADEAARSAIWVADDLGIAVTQSQVLDGNELITLRLVSLKLGEPDSNLFVIPEGYREGKGPREWRD